MTRVFSFLKEYKLIIFIVIVTPIIVSQIIRIPLGHWTIGDDKSWVGFIGNYSGGVLGGIVAFFAARFQIKKQAFQNQLHQFGMELPVLTKVEIECEKILEQLLNSNEFYNNLMVDKETYLIKFDALIWERWENVHQINDPYLQEQLNKHQEALQRNIEVFQVDINRMMVELEEKKNLHSKMNVFDYESIKLDSEILRDSRYIEIIKEDKVKYLLELKFCIEKTRKILGEITNRKAKIHDKLKAENYYQKDLLSNTEYYKVNR